MSIYGIRQPSGILGQSITLNPRSFNASPNRYGPAGTGQLGMSQANQGTTTAQPISMPPTPNWPTMPNWVDPNFNRPGTEPPATPEPKPAATTPGNGTLGVTGTARWAGQEPKWFEHYDPITGAPRFTGSIDPYQPSAYQEYVNRMHQGRSVRTVPGGTTPPPNRRY